jgi:hypothetical protein
MALIIGTADHRRRIHGHKQRALICRIRMGLHSATNPSGSASALTVVILT